MVVNLAIYVRATQYSKTKEERENVAYKLKKSVLLANTIYIVGMYIAILTGTSSYTYMEEKMGYKGWFESGNSIGAILLLSLFVVLPLWKHNKYRIWVGVNTVLTGIYLTTLIGTRVGLFGFILVLIFYIACEILYYLLHNEKINKKVLTVGIGCLAIFIAIVGMFGSNTLTRRKHLKEQVNTIVDERTGEVSPLTGDLTAMKYQIEDGVMAEKFLSDAQKRSILDLYEIAREKQVQNTDMRKQQMIYHLALVKNQKDIGMLFLGNGYVSHFRELVMESEIPAFLFNFGILGFILYFVPFIGIEVYGMYIGIRKYKEIDVTYMMAIGGIGFAICLSFFSGYIFFNISNMMMVTILQVIVVNKIRNWKGVANEKENRVWNHKSDIRGSRTSTSRHRKQTSGKL